MYLSTTFIFWLCSTIHITTSTPLSQSPPPSPTESIPTCTGALSAANTEVAPILPENKPVPSPYRLPDSFVQEHIVVFAVDFNTNLPRAAWATYCLDQCIAYVGNGTRTCRSFEVDQGVPYPPVPETETETEAERKGDGGNNNAKRWWCEGFDVELSAELYVPNEIEGSYGRFLGVNRLCGGSGSGNGSAGEVVRDY